MDPRDPIAQSIDYDFESGLQDASRAQTILKMLPRLVTDQLNPQPIQPTSGLPQTGQEALADIGALAGQAPSGIGQDVRMGTNLGNIYKNRANRNLTADIANAGQAAEIPMRTQQALNLLRSLQEPSAPEITLKEGEKRFRQTPEGYQEVAAGGQSAGIAKPDPSKFTPESLRAFQQSGGDYGALVPREGSDMAPLPGVPGLFYKKGPGGPQIVDASGRAMSPQEVEAMDLARRRAGASSVKVGVDMTGDAYAKAAGPKLFERDLALEEAARTAAQNIQSLDQLYNHIKSSKALTGVGSEILLNVKRLQQLVDSADPVRKQQIVDTEYLDATLGADVFPMIKALGIGARGLDTPAEREFLRKVMTGTIANNKDTLLKLTETRRNIAKRAIDRYNERVKEGRLGRYERATQETMQPISVPQTPGGPSQEDLEFTAQKHGITVEEVKRRLGM